MKKLKSWHDVNAVFNGFAAANKARSLCARERGTAGPIGSEGQPAATAPVEIHRAATDRRTAVAIRRYSSPIALSLLRHYRTGSLRCAVILSPRFDPRRAGHAALAAAPVLAQASRSAIRPLKPPPPAPIKPYKPVAVTPPAPYNDPGFVAFRKQLADVAAKKDRAALAKLVVAQGFFWMQDKDLADKRKSGIDNLAKAIDLDAKDGSGWDAAGRLCQRADRRGNARSERRLLRAGRSDHRSEGVRSARQGDADRSVRMGLSDQGRRRSARRGAAEFAGRSRSSA